MGMGKRQRCFFGTRRSSFLRRIHFRHQRAKKSQDALLESEARFKSFMDHFPATAYIKDENLKHVYANRAALDFAGLPEEKYIGSRTHDIYPAEIAEKLERLDQMVLDEARMVEPEGSLLQRKKALRGGNETSNFP